MSEKHGGTPPTPRVPRMSDLGFGGYPDDRSDRTPSLAPKSRVPKGAEEDGDDDGGISGFLTREAQYRPNLEWLEFADEQPQILPGDPNTAVIRGIEEAWNGTNDGSGPRPRRPEPPPPPPVQGSGQPGRDVAADIMAEVYRSASLGVPFPQIRGRAAARVKEAREYAKGEVPVEGIRTALKEVRAEAPLLQAVYLRPEGFPGLLRGRWAKMIRDKCASHAYWLVPPGHRLASSHAFLGKKVVTEVPWGDALAHYAPRLKAAGFKTGGEPKAALRRLASALSARPEADAQQVVAYQGPVLSTEVDRPLSLPQGPDHQRYARRDLERARKLARLHGVSEEGTLAEVSARVLAAAHKGGAYEGETFAQVSLHREREIQAQDPAVRTAKLEKFLDAVRKEHGISQDVEQRIRASKASLKTIFRTVSAYLTSRKEAKMRADLAPKAREYTGHRALGTSVAAAPRARKASRDEVRAAVKRAINEAHHGRPLRGKWASEVWAAAQPILDRYLKKHAGKLGTLYVDSGAYRQMVGCEEGAKTAPRGKHLKILANDECNGCVHNTVAGCRLYGRKLLSRAAGEALTAPETTGTQTPPSRAAEFDGSAFEDVGWEVSVDDPAPAPEDLNIEW